MVGSANVVLPHQPDGPQDRGYSNFNLLFRPAGITAAALEKHALKICGLISSTNRHRRPTSSRRHRSSVLYRSSSSKHRCDRALSRFSRSSSQRAGCGKIFRDRHAFLSLFPERIEVRMTNLRIAAYQYGSTPHPPLSSIEEERRSNRPFVIQRSVLVTSDSPSRRNLLDPLATADATALQIFLRPRVDAIERFLDFLD